MPYGAPMITFIVACPHCNAKVAAEQTGVAERSYWIEEAGEPFAERLHVGNCPKCKTMIAGTSQQTAFENIDSEYDEWSDVVRVYPDPPRTFTSYRIPAAVKQSLTEADKVIQAGAYLAACIMFGRALEAVCRNVLLTKDELENHKRLMLGEGLKQLKAKNVIDQRLFDWSQQLQAFRNMAAHADDTPISREDAQDLQAFVHAIIEYIYDLADRYEEFKARIARREERKKLPNPLRGNLGPAP